MNLNNQNQVNREIYPVGIDEKCKKQSRRHSQMISTLPKHLRRDIDSKRNAYSSPHKSRLSDQDSDDINQVCALNPSIYIDIKTLGRNNDQTSL